MKREIYLIIFILAGLLLFTSIMLLICSQGAGEKRVLYINTEDGLGGAKISIVCMEDSNACFFSKGLKYLEKALIEEIRKDL